MKNVLIMNLGNRDLQIQEDKLVKMKALFNGDEEMEDILNSGVPGENNFKVFSRNFRKLTKKLVECYPKGSDYVDFPIIESITKKIEGDLESGTSEKEELEKIILIVTDQQDIKFKEQDTIHLGEIIEKLWHDKKLEIGLKQSKDNVEVVSCCVKLNPSDYDEMRKFYENELRGEYDSNKIFINITGGTPAMSFGLLYNTSMNSSCRVIPFYTKQNTNTSVKLNVSETFRKNEDKRQIGEFIIKNDYMATKILLEKYNEKYEVSDKKYKTALNMVEAAHARIQFDFENASAYIEKAEDYDSESRTVCDKFIYFIKELQDKKKIYLLNELKNNAIYEYENGAYTDFLGRIFRMQEDIYSSILLKKNMLRLNENDKLKLNKDEVESAGIVVKEKIDIPYMSLILDAILEESEEHDLYQYCAQLTKLKTLRNKSILAHGYKGVSKEAIDSEIGSTIEFLDNLILKYKKVFNIEIDDDNFYDKNGEFIKRLIKLIEEI